MNTSTDIRLDIRSQIDALVEAISKHDDVARLILFGSSARQNDKAVNDIDVLILVKHDEVDIDSRTLCIRKDTYQTMHLPLDIIIESLATFESRRHLPTLERVIDREGVVVYAA